MHVKQITSLVGRGTFPQLNLAPVNFDALFMNYLQQQQGEQAQNSSSTGRLMNTASMTVIGASYGTALAITLARNASGCDYGAMTQNTFIN